MIHDGLATRQLRDLVDRVVAHRHVDERQSRGAALSAQVAPRARERAHLGLRFVDEDLGLHAAPPEEPLQLEGVVADRVAVRERRHDLIGYAKALAHATGLRPRQRTGSARSYRPANSSCVGNSSRSKSA